MEMCNVLHASRATAATLMYLGTRKLNMFLLSNSGAFAHACDLFHLPRGCDGLQTRGLLPTLYSVP